jgi:branched-chain amino acid transport system permease protein
VLLLAMLSCAIIGFIIELAAYRPLRRASRLNVLITAIGVSLLLQNVGQLPYVFGASPQNMPPLIKNTEVVRLSMGEAGHDVVIGRVDVIIFCTSAALMLLLEFLVFRTRFGTAMRAVSFNTDTAALMGIPVDRVISITFVIGSALAAAAGFLYVMKYQASTSRRIRSGCCWVLRRSPRR